MQPRDQNGEVASLMAGSLAVGRKLRSVFIAERGQPLGLLTGIVVDQNRHARKKAVVDLKVEMDISGRTEGSNDQADSGGGIEKRSRQRLADQMVKEHSPVTRSSEVNQAERITLLDWRRHCVVVRGHASTTLQ